MHNLFHLRRGAVALQREIRLAQAFELRMLRMQAAQIGVGLVGEGRRLDDAARVQQLRLAVEVTAETERVGASAAGVACVFQNGETERYLGVGNLLAGELGALHERRKAIGGRIEPPIAGTADLRMDGPGRRVEPGRGDPHGFVLELTIELGEGNAIRLIGAAQLAVGRKALRKLGGETDRRRRELRSQRLLRRRRRNASGQRQTSLLGRLGSRGGDLCICRYGMAQRQTENVKASNRLRSILLSSGYDRAIAARARTQKWEFCGEGLRKIAIARAWTWRPKVAQLARSSRPISRILR